MIETFPVASCYVIMLHKRPRVSRQAVVCKGHGYQEWDQCPVYWKRSRIKECLAYYWRNAPKLSADQLRELRQFIREHHTEPR